MALLYKFLAFRQLINQDLPARLRRLPGFRRWIVENVLDTRHSSPPVDLDHVLPPPRLVFSHLCSPGRLETSWSVILRVAKEKRMNSQHRTLRRLQNLAPTQWRIWPSITILFHQEGDVSFILFKHRHAREDGHILYPWYAS